WVHALPTSIRGSLELDQHTTAHSFRHGYSQDGTRPHSALPGARAIHRERVLRRTAEVQALPANGVVPSFGISSVSRSRLSFAHRDPRAPLSDGVWTRPVVL